jgi:hypothetical protein
MNIRNTIAGALLLFVQALGLIPTAQAAIHPGVMQNQADIDRMRTKVLAGAQPWKASYDRLISNAYAQSTWVAGPTQNPCAGNCPDGESYYNMARDSHSAYQNALRYRITGDTAHANRARDTMNAWRTTMTGAWSGDSNAQLRCGLYGFNWAAAAELMRGYSGWSASDFNAFKNWLLTKFYPVSSDFLIRHNGTCFDHYWANWDLANMRTILAIGVLCDDNNKITEATNYFKSGIGTGKFDRLCNRIHGELGQCQESGRDQGHATMAIALTAEFLECAYNQGQDLFAYDWERMRKLFEYTAQYNLNISVPFSAYQNCEGWNMTEISSGSRGMQRPGWDLIYNHYVKIKGRGNLCPSITQFAVNMRPEGGAGHYGTASGGLDSLGFTTLTHSIDQTGGGFPAAGNYSLKNRGNGLMLDSYGRTANGSNCAMYADSTSVNQTWTLSYINSNTVKLRAVGGGLYLDGMGRTANGSICGLFSDSTNNNQRWTIIDMGGGYYKLKNVGTNMCVDVGASPWANGDNMEQWGDGGNVDLQWQFVAP